MSAAKILRAMTDQMTNEPGEALERKLESLKVTHGSRVAVEGYFTQSGLPWPPYLYFSLCGQKIPQTPLYWKEISHFPASSGESIVMMISASSSSPSDPILTFLIAEFSFCCPRIISPGRILFRGKSSGETLSNAKTGDHWPTFLVILSMRNIILRQLSLFQIWFCRRYFSSFFSAFSTLSLTSCSPASCL